MVECKIVSEPFMQTAPAKASAQRLMHVNARQLFASFEDGAAWRAADIAPAPGGMHFTVHREGQEWGKFCTPLLGTHNVLNSLAALAAGNFGAVSTMASLIGEDEFSLLFHKGKKENIHFSKVTDEFLLITIFGKEISLGFLRLKVAEATEKLVGVLKPGS